MQLVTGRVHLIRVGQGNSVRWLRTAAGWRMRGRFGLDLWLGGGAAAPGLRPLPVDGALEELLFPGDDAVEEHAVSLFEPAGDLGDVDVRRPELLERPLHRFLRFGRVTAGEDVQRRIAVLGPGVHGEV